jgi:hypothetical protein
VTPSTNLSEVARQPAPTPGVEEGCDAICRTVTVADLGVMDQILVAASPTKSFLAGVLGYDPKLEAESHPSFIHTPQSSGIQTNMLLSAADFCFQSHRPFGLRPEVLWQTILGQVAEEVKQNPEEYRSLFTRRSAEEGKEEILVRHDGLRMGSSYGWDVAIGMFRDPLEERVPSDIMTISQVDDLTTAGQAEKLACLVTFMDAASPFYDYKVRTKCGIPKVALFGTEKDWLKLKLKVGLIRRHFPRLSAYFNTILPIITRLAEEAGSTEPIRKAFVGSCGWRTELRGGDEFWTSIYKRNSRSGGDTLSGWLTSFFAFARAPGGEQFVLRTQKSLDWKNLDEWGAGLGSNKFPGSVSCVDFKWDYFGRTHPMKLLGGVMTTVRHDHEGVEYITPRLGWAVAHAQ